jgi:hypothetical protein
MAVGQVWLECFFLLETTVDLNKISTFENA